jgi:DNA-directed RNA polymerase specialized sigma24 family protein
VNPSALSRYRAERLLRKDFSALRSKVLAVVRSRLHVMGVSLDPADLEACYAQAWQGLYATVLDGELVENPSAWLVLVTFRRAIDESRAARRAQLGAASRDAAYEPPASDETGAALPFEPDFAQQLDDRARLRAVFEGLRTRLSTRECEAASLCYLQGLSRADAAAQMGISEARMRKLMEGSGASRPGVASKVGGLLEAIEGGGWCEQQGSLMRAFAFGILDPDGERYALALAHCRACPACRAHVASLRGLASVLPLPLLPPFALASAGGHAGPPRLEGTPGAARFSRSGGAARSSWSGIGPSLTAKLAAVSALALAGGYAVLGSRAHGSPAGAPPAQSSTVAPASTSTLSSPRRHGSAQALLPATLPAVGARAPRVPSARRSLATRSDSLPSHSSPERQPSALEFLPEQRTAPLTVTGLAQPPPSTRDTPQVVRPTVTGAAQPPASTSEFGIE